MKNKICPVCEEGNLQVEINIAQQVVGAITLEVEQRSHWCDACGLTIATTEDLKVNARAMRAAERASIGKLTGSEIALIRKQLRITQEAAGRLFGGGPVAFCKYENDDLAPSEAMDNLLWAAREVPGVAVSLGARNGIDIAFPVDAVDKIALQSGIRVEFVPADPSHGRDIAAAITSAKEATKSAWASCGTWAMNGMSASNQESLTVSEYA